MKMRTNCQHLGLLSSSNVAIPHRSIGWCCIFTGGVTLALVLLVLVLVLHWQSVQASNPVYVRLHHRVLQDGPDDRERPQKQHNGAEKIAKEKHDADALDDKPDERMLGQDQRDAAKEEKRGLDFRRPCKEVDGPRRPDDQHHANDKEDVADGKETRVEKRHDSKKEKHHAGRGGRHAVFWRLV